MNRREFVQLTTGAVAGSAITLALPQVNAQTNSQQRVLVQEIERDGEDWSFYPSDDFDTPYLKRRWLIRDTQVGVGDGRVILSNRNGTTGSILLKGLFRLFSG